MKKYFIQTFGCQMNVYDGWRIAAMLDARGMMRTDDVADADMIILNTCAVRAEPVRTDRQPPRQPAASANWDRPFQGEGLRGRTIHAGERQTPDRRS